MGLLDFFYRNSHQRNNKSETSTFSLVWLALPSHIQPYTSQKMT